MHLEEIACFLFHYEFQGQRILIPVSFQLCSLQNLLVHGTTVPMGMDAIVPLWAHPGPETRPGPEAYLTSLQREGMSPGPGQGQGQGSLEMEHPFLICWLLGILQDTVKPSQM